MIAALYVLFILNCLFLIMVVLLQAGKGDGMGVAFGGGGSDTVFGTRGVATFLSKLTVGSAFLFMVLSIVLAFFSSNPASRVSGGYVDPEEVSGSLGETLGAEGEQEGSGLTDEPFELEIPPIEPPQPPGTAEQLPTPVGTAEIPTPVGTAEIAVPLDSTIEIPVPLGNDAEPPAPSGTAAQ
jgi:preprotein translocase subunit SecG